MPTQMDGRALADVCRVPANDLGALRTALESHGGRVAAFFGEPVIGAAGVYPPDPGYWDGVQDSAAFTTCWWLLTRS